MTANQKDRPMPPFVAFAGALGGLAVVRWAYRTARRINEELEEARRVRVAETVSGRRSRRPSGGHHLRNRRANVGGNSARGAECQRLASF